MEWQKRLEEVLVSFDDIAIKIPYNRRIAVVPIYDFFQILLQEVGVQFCSVPRELFADMLLNSRWRKLDPLLSMVSAPNDWAQTIAALNRIRNRTSHDEYYDPPTQALEQIRKRALEFKEFILTTGKEYYRQSQGVTFSQRLIWLSNGYVMRAKSILKQYGDKTPLFTQRDLTRGDTHSFQKLSSLIKSIESRVSTIKNMNDLTIEDLDNLLEIAKELEFLDAREWAYVEQNKCPICGNIIAETQQEFGGTREDPHNRVLWRVGCDKCEYEIASDLFEI